MVEEKAKQATSNLTQCWKKGSKVPRNTGAHLLLYNICIFKMLDEGKWEQSAKSLLSRKTGEVTWKQSEICDNRMHCVVTNNFLHEAKQYTHTAWESPKLNH
jgi:hypothetical protein